MYVTYNSRTTHKLIKHNEPWQLPSYHGCRGAPPPALRHRDISQHVIQHKAASLKLERVLSLMVSISYYLQLLRLRLCKTTHKTLTKSAARCTSQPRWPPSSHGRLDAPQTLPSIEENSQNHRPSFLLMDDSTLGRDGMPLQFDGHHGSVASFISEL